MRNTHGIPRHHSNPDWTTLMQQHARTHRTVAAGLAVAAVAVVLLLVQSIVQLAAGQAVAGFRMALLGGLAGFALMMVLDTTLG